MDENQGQSPASVPPSRAVVDVMIIEDQRDIREGLRVLINGSQGYCCIGAYRSVEEALAQEANACPSVVLLDIGLPGISGIEGIPALLDQYRGSVVIMLTVYDDDERVFKAICAGASGYLLKKTPPAKLLDCLREAADGGAPMSPEVARRVICIFREAAPKVPAAHDLTPHELRLLQLLAQGHNYKTAAAELGVSVNTVAFHMKHVYLKLHVHSKSEAVAQAIRRRIVR